MNVCVLMYFPCPLLTILFTIYLIHSAKLPEMSSAEKVTLIQERMKNIQKKWVELKAEMSKIDRKRRKARKREREGEIPGQ